MSQWCNKVSGSLRSAISRPLAMPTESQSAKRQSKASANNLTINSGRLPSWYARINGLAARDLARSISFTAQFSNWM